MPERFTHDTNRRAGDALSKAEDAFKKVTKKTIEGPAPKAAIPGARELVSIRIDQDVLGHFQADGPGWQERINAALRTAAGL